MKTSLVLLALMTSLTIFANDKAGNGGGGICYKDGKCVTLAQAGFRVKDAEVERNTLLTIELMNELQTVLGLLPSQINLRLPAIIGSKGSIQEVEITDQKRMKSFLKEYRNVLMANGAANLAKNVEIMAFTVKRSSYDQGITYLINGKFDSLSLRGQALTLIHEYVLREKKFTLTETLTLDGAILDYINARENNVAPNKVKLINAAKKLFYTNGEESNGYFFNEALVGKVPLSIEESKLQLSAKNSGSTDLEITFDQILRLSKDRPLMSLVNEKIEVPVAKTMSRQEFLLRFATFVNRKFSTSNAERIIVDDELFSEYIIKENINADIFEICGNIEDTNSWLVGNPSSSQLNFAMPVSCSWSTLVPINWISTKFDIDLYSNSQGGKLNLGRSYECEKVKDEGAMSFVTTLTCK